MPMTNAPRDADEARRRRDRDQARDGARGDPQHRRLALDHPLGEHPRQRGDGGGELASRPSPCRRGRRRRRREPALKPNQPTHSSDAPISVSVRLCGAIASLP